MHGLAIAVNVATSPSHTPTDVGFVVTDGGVFTVQPSDEGAQFRAVFSNACASATTTAATLSTNSPSVLSSPIDATTCAGVSHTFTATASNNGTVQWQYSSDSGATYNNIGGPVATAAGLYRAVFTNACGTATSNPASLTVNTPPSVTTKPTSVGVCDGDVATFTAEATGTPSPAMQWQVQVAGVWSDLAGETNPTLSFVTNASQNGNYYRAAFTNSCAIVRTGAAKLTVRTAPSITTHPQSKTVTPGATESLTAAASGTTPTVKWQISTNGGTTWQNITGATSMTYTFTVNASAQYRAVFTNPCGVATTNVATITLN